MTTIQSLARRHILEMKPYSSARSLYSSGLFLDANESPRDVFESTNLLNRYPDGSNQALRERIGEYFNLDHEFIAVGNGSDELIDILVRIFCDPKKDHILLFPPTFLMYNTAAILNEVGIVEITHHENSFSEKNTLPISLPVEEVFQAISKYDRKEKLEGRIKIIFICNPNNPTGSVYRKEDIQEICKNSGCIVVLDEAYGEFTQQESFIKEIPNFPNLIVLKTFSKAFARAGIRIGMAFSSKEIIELIQKVKHPYNINSLTTQRVLDWEDMPTHIDENVRYILEQKDILEKGLRGIAIVKSIFPSESNFFLVRFYNADKAFDALIKAGIVTRRIAPSYGLDNCLRITVGTYEENTSLINILKGLSP